MAFSLEEAYDNFKDGAGNALSSAGGSMLDWGKTAAGKKTLLSLGLSAAFNDRLAPNQAKVGYQGSIPDYTMVRERVNPTASRNIPKDAQGRPGLGGVKARRFFSDAKYIKDADKASGREKTAAVRDTDTTQYTKDILGDQYRDLLAGNKVFTAAEQAANPSEYGYTEDGRRIFIPDEKAAFLGQTERVADGPQVLGDVYQVPQVEDPDTGEMVDIAGIDMGTLGATFYTKDNQNVYVDKTTGREVINDYAFQNPINGRAATSYDDEGYATFSPNEGKTFNEDDYLIETLGTQNPDLAYDDSGRVLESEAEYFTNLEAATQDARAQANTLGGVSGQAGLAMGGKVMGYANGGGIGSKLNKVTRGRNPSMDGIGYLNGPTDGMADEVPATIEGNQPAALSDGEFVITADVVAHLGNGNSEAGAKILEGFMRSIREKRTDNPNQGKEIDARREIAGLEGMPTRMAATGGQIKKFAVGGEVDNTTAGVDSTFNPIMGDYLTNMLGKADAVGDKPYEAYDGYGATYKDVTDPDTGETTSELDEAGILTAGSSALQDKAFTSAGDIDTRGFGELTSDELTGTPSATGETDAYGNPVTEGGLMNPYIQGSLNPQLRAAQEEAARQEAEQNIRMTQSGSFGGSRNAIMSGMLARDSAQNQADIVAKGYNTAYENARNQFGEDRQFGLDAIQKQADLGQTQQDILQTNIDADRGAFEDERDYEAKIPQYLSDMLQYLPVASSAQQSGSDSDLAQIIAGTGGINTLLGGGQQVPAGYTMGTDPTTGEPTLVKKLT
tara:strand:+ start:1318 stop:3675 length:2358 start_codon:yes stop_codon:yes gene_type:complete